MGSKEPYYEVLNLYFCVYYNVYFLADVHHIIILHTLKISILFGFDVRRYVWSILFCFCLLQFSPSTINFTKN